MAFLHHNLPHLLGQAPKKPSIFPGYRAQYVTSHIPHVLPGEERLPLTIPCQPLTIFRVHEIFRVFKLY